MVSRNNSDLQYMSNKSIDQFWINHMVHQDTWKVEVNFVLISGGFPTHHILFLIICHGICYLSFIVFGRLPTESYFAGITFNNLLIININFILKYCD